MSKSNPRETCRYKYCQTLYSLHRITKGSNLSYEKSDSKWPDLVLRNKKGKRIATVMTYGPFGGINHDLRYGE